MQTKPIYRLLILTSIFCLLSVISCGKRNPGLSDKQLRTLINDKAQKAAEAAEELRKENILNANLSNTSVTSQRNKNFSEIRSVDPQQTPDIIDIAGNIKNERAFKLSDIASSVRYIQLQQPPDSKIENIINFLSDDEHIFIRTFEGLFCYSINGQYLYTVVLNDIDSSRMTKHGDWIMFSGDPIISGISSNADLLNGALVFHSQQRSSTPDVETDYYLNVFDVKELDAQMRLNINTEETGKKSAKPQYQRQINATRIGGGNYMLTDNQSLFNSRSLTGVSIYGDTLCKFVDYDRPTRSIVERTGAFSSIYRIGGQVMLHKGHNDTIFRVEPPNRFVPTYVMQWGEHKPDINEYRAGGDLIGAFVIREWTETFRFIFIEYTEGRSYPIRIDAGKVKFHWAIYDKVKKTLTHILLPSSYAKAQGRTLSFPPMFENDIEPVGMPFWPKGVNHRNEMYMVFSKEQVNKYISTALYQNDKLQTIHDNMPDDGICIMIVK